MSSISSSDLSENLREYLCEEHLAELRASGLSDETILAEGFQTVDDMNFVAEELGWQPCRRLQNMGPFLRIPYRKQNGTSLNYFRYKPLHPRTRPKEDGSQQIVKYEAPRKKSPPPYFPAGAIETINTSQARLFITEGEKKAIKATQEGFPCIGLPGVSNWSKKRKVNQLGQKVGKRHLNKWLGRIDWRGRDVFIVFDADDKRNPDVNREAAELARTLEEHRATAHILVLPVYRNESGEYEKQGLDDYLVRYGRETFLQLLDTQTVALNIVSLENFRGQMLRRRKEISERGLYLDSSPPGTGKSHHDTLAVPENGKMLVLLQTHSQCESAIAQFADSGIEAVKFPERSESNCEQYRQIREVESTGLNASSIVCRKCPGRVACDYHHQCNAAKLAKVTLATHERKHQSSRTLMRGKKVISVHEDLANFLAHLVEAEDFEQVIAASLWAANSHRNYREVGSRLLAVAEHCYNALQLSRMTRELEIPVFESPVENLGQSLNHLLRDILEFRKYSPPFGFPESLQQTINGQAFRLCQLILADRIRRLYVRNTIQDNGFQKKTIVGILQTDFPPNGIVILNDGTATLESIPPEFRSRIRIIAPCVQAEQIHPVIQYPHDITKSRSSLFRLASYIRSLLRLHPEKQRIGIITHKKFVVAPDETCPLRELLASEENARIVKLDWFRGTESRGSNSWKDECDLLVVAGTPRVPTPTIQNRLLQLGNPFAANRDGQWTSLDYWSGRCLDGKRETVRSRGYRDHDWHEAHRQIVHAELEQAIGRSRSVCSDGISLTIILSTEPLGYPLAGTKLEILNERIARRATTVIYHLLVAAGTLSPIIESAAIPNGESCPSSLDCLPDGEQSEITAEVAYRVLKQHLPLFFSGTEWERCPTVKTPDLTRRMEIPARTARDLLAELERFGLMTREGVRKGWYVTVENLRMFDQIPGFLVGQPSEPPQCELLDQTVAVAINPVAARLAGMNALRNRTPRRFVR